MAITLENSYSPQEIREKIQTVSRPDGSTVSYYADHTGSIHSTVYKPFPGVSLVRKNVHMPQFITNWRYGPVNALAVEYCYEGRLECQVGEECLYIAPGDIVIFRTDPNLRMLQYPSSHYHAAALMIYLDETSPVLNMHLGMAGFSPEMLIEKYLPDHRYYSILKNTDLLKNVFDTMVHAPESVKTMYYGVKILESLVLLASEIPGISENPPQKVPRAQAEMVKQVYHHVMEHPEERYTIEELAEKFTTSPTHLKQCFQIVYGTSMQKFIREQKIKAAAKVLETTDRKVTEVAQMFGYSNISKFAGAFKSIMGEYPKQYSMHCCVNPENNSEENV